MDKEEQLIRTELMKLIAAYSDNLKFGEVLSIDQDEKTAKVKLLDSENEVTCRLRASKTGDQKGIWMEPIVGSSVIVGKMTQYKQYVIIMCDEVKALNVVCDEVDYEVDQLNISCDDVEFNNGTFGGLVKSAVVANKINALVEDINVLKGILGGWTPIPNDGGLALKTASASWAGTALVLSTKQMYENDKVKH